MTTLSTYEAIRERLAGLTGPDREVDWMIADVTDHPSFSKRVKNMWPPFGVGSPLDKNIHRYTGSVDAILDLIKRDDLPGWVIYTFGNGDLDVEYLDIRAFTGWRAGIAPIGASLRDGVKALQQWPIVHAPTDAIALCLAFIEAKIQIAKADAEGGRNG